MEPTFDHYVFVGYDGEAILRLNGTYEELSALVGGYLTVAYGPKLDDGTTLVIYANNDGIADCRPNREVVPVEMSGAPMCLDGVRRIYGPMVVARVDEDGKTLGLDRPHASVVCDYVAQFPRIDLLTMARILSGLDSSIEDGWDPVYRRRRKTPPFRAGI